MPKVTRVAIPPDPSIFKRLAATNMPVYRALAELIDNSIDSFITNRDRLKKHGCTRANVEVHFGKSVVITDNCFGMDEETLIDSFRLGKSKKGTMSTALGLIGRYGLGLKAAAMVMGKRMIVRTKLPSASHAMELFLDADQLEKEGWEVDPPKSVTFENGHGTEVEIARLHRQYNRQTISKVVEQSSRLFRHYLQAGDLSIFIDGEPVPPFQEPDLKPGTHREFEITLSKGGGTVKGWVGMLKKHKAASGQYGFTLVRNKRVVDEYVKIGVTHSNSESMIIGELFLDGWEVDFTKAKIPADLPGYEELDGKLRKEISTELDINKRAANPGKYRTDGRGDVPATTFDTQKSMDSIMKLLPESLQKAHALAIETGDRKRVASPETIEKKSEDLSRLLLSEQVRVIEKDLGPNNAPFTASREEDSGVWSCRINSSRPFIRSLSKEGRHALGALFAAQVVAEQEFDSKTRERLRSLQDTFLRVAEKDLDEK